MHTAYTGSSYNQTVAETVTFQRRSVALVHKGGEGDEAAGREAMSKSSVVSVRIDNDSSRRACFGAGRSALADISSTSWCRTFNQVFFAVPSHCANARRRRPPASCFSRFATCSATTSLPACRWQGNGFLTPRPRPNRSESAANRSASERRHTFLQLAFRLSVPFIVVVAILHWPVSQSIFLTIIRADDYSCSTNGIAYDQELSTSAPDWSLLGLVLAVA